VLLAVYYQPTPDTAYQSVLNISTHVQFGWWIRSIHRSAWCCSSSPWGSGSRATWLGHFLLVTLRGGEQISAATLGRFFDLHVLVLPAVIVAYLLGHFWMIRRHGISGRL
jgi:quinol-cytochrome oxidoreductase complex cytochrome b subunit